MKCYFCDCAFDCFILANENLSEELINRAHLEKEPNCTYLLGSMGTVLAKRYRSDGIRINLDELRPQHNEQNNEPSNHQPVTRLYESDDLIEQNAHNVYTQFRQSITCKYCHKNRANILFLPCNHVAACPTCLITDKCILCQSKVTYRIHVMS